jgi:hypothetical protein
MGKGIGCIEARHCKASEERGAANEWAAPRPAPPCVLATRAGEHEASRRMKTELLVQLDGLTRRPGERVFVLVRGGSCAAAQAAPTRLAADTQTIWHMV